MPDLFPYQETGVEWLAPKDVAFLADQPGLGKTPQAVRAAQKRWAGTKTHPRICVICPKSAIENWWRELKRWWPTHDAHAHDDMVINFDQLIQNGSSREVFERTPWDIIIIDEAHRLKTPGAQRTRAVYKVVNARRKTAQTNRQQKTAVWLLSGTPAKNHTGELYTHLAVLRPDLIRDRSGRVMSQEQFEEKYCRVGFDKHGHRRIRGSKNVKELRDLLFDEGFMLRRRKSEVQTDLPDLIFDDYPLSGNLGDVRGFPKHWIEGMSSDEVMEYLKTQSGSLAEWRHNVAQAKLPLVKDFVENELEPPGEKMILFYQHTLLGKELHHLMGAYQPVIVNGETKVAQHEVDVFQNNPNCRLFIGQISTCQEALNITAATQVAFAESAWSPSDNYQAACRAHRYGMGGSLIVRFLSLAGSTDEIVQRVISRKALELAELFD